MSSLNNSHSSSKQDLAAKAKKEFSPHHKKNSQQKQENSDSSYHADIVTHKKRKNYSKSWRKSIRDHKLPWNQVNNSDVQQRPLERKKKNRPNAQPLKGQLSDMPNTYMHNPTNPNSLLSIFGTGTPKSKDDINLI